MSVHKRKVSICVFLSLEENNSGVQSRWNGFHGFIRAIIIIHKNMMQRKLWGRTKQTDFLKERVYI